MNKTWIAISFDEGQKFKLMKVSGENGLRKKVKVSDVQNIRIYLTDDNGREFEKIGNITFPSEMNGGELVITYRPEEQVGDVQLVGTDYIWSYDTKDENEQTAKTEGKNKGAIDKEKVKKIEEEKQKEKMKVFYANELIEKLQEEIVGQEEAIKKISEIVTSNFRRKESEVTVIAEFGPTGVGKTELGKVLHGVLSELTGIEYGFKQVALNEFVGDHYSARFFGSPAGYVGYGSPTVFECVRKNPYQVFVFDEIEKASDGIWTALMEAFSAGVVHMADNSEDIDLSHCIIIITSNIPIDMDAYNSASSFERKEICRNVLAGRCGHPEIAGKISHCLAFQELSDDANMDIIEKFVRKELENYDMILTDIEPSLVLELKEQKTSYGARGVRDVVNEALIPYTAYDMDMDRFKEKKVRLSGTIENVQIAICE